MQGLKLIFSAGTVLLAMGTAVATAGIPNTPNEATKPGTVDAASEARANNSAAGSSGTEQSLSAVETKKNSLSTAMSNSAADNQTQAVQDRLAAIVEDDYAFEKARRELANEVELEKMRSELRKLRGEDRKAPQPVASAASEAEPQQQSVQTIIMPRVVLEAQIGGAQRTAVTDGDTLRYVRAGEVFSMGGHNYKLAKDKKSVLLVESAPQ